MNGQPESVLHHLFKWSQEQAVGETINEYRRLRKVFEGNAFRYLEYSESLDNRKRKTFARALVKRYFSFLIPIEVEAEEKALIDGFMNYGDYEIAPGVRTSRAHPTRYHQFLEAEKSSEENRFKATKNAIAHSAKKAFLGRNLGSFNKSMSRGGVLWFEQTTANGMEIRTVIDLGGRRLIGYEHQLADKRKKVFFRTSILGTLGISAQCDWQYGFPSQADEICNSVAEFAEEFLQGVARYLEQ